MSAPDSFNTVAVGGSGGLHDELERQIVDYDSRCACAQGAMGSAVGLVLMLILQPDWAGDGWVGMIGLAVVGMFAGTAIGKIGGKCYFKVRAIALRARLDNERRAAHQN